MKWHISSPSTHKLMISIGAYDVDWRPPIWRFWRQFDIFLPNLVNFEKCAAITSRNMCKNCKQKKCDFNFFLCFWFFINFNHNQHFKSIKISVFLVSLIHIQAGSFMNQNWSTIFKPFFMTLQNHKLVVLIHNFEQFDINYFNL